MLDPFPPPSSWLSSWVDSAAHRWALPTLPLHLHQVMAAYLFYHFIHTVLSPRLSAYLFPAIYSQFSRRTRINWDVHVVSLAQSCIINAMALWVMSVDEERKAMSSVERVYGYTGACGMIQGFSAGYFLWDLVVTTRYVGIFGLGMWAHAICALCVFSFGFRPFLNFYGPTFILYELSSPFLNIHWFLDKVQLTGSSYQWYNGMLLLGTFFCCRLVWGTYQSIRVYQDVWAALHLPVDRLGRLLGDEPTGNGTTSAAESLFPPFPARTDPVTAQSEMLRFVGPETQAIPVSLAAIYLTLNVVLNSLNFYWFGKMIETVRKRFDGGKSGSGSDVSAETDAVAVAPNATGLDRPAARLHRRRASNVILDAVDSLDHDRLVPELSGDPQPKQPNGHIVPS